MEMLVIFSKKRSKFIEVIFIMSLLFLLGACGNNHSSGDGGEQEFSKTDNMKKESNGTEELSKEEAKIIVEDLMSGIVQTFRDSGQKYNWNNYDNPADFTIMRPELLKYASVSFTDGFLEETAAEYYCQCDMSFFPIADLDIRFNLHEISDAKFVASSIEFFSEIGPGGSTVYYTIIKENETWLLDDIEWVSYKEQALNVTWEEVKANVENNWGEVEFINETQHNGRKVYIINIPVIQHVRGVYADNTEILYTVPIELFPETMKRLTPEEAEKLVKERLGYENVPEVTVRYDQDTEEGLYFIQVYTIHEKGTPYQRVATIGWFEVNPITGEIYDSVLGRKME